ncbi:MAG: hypothetical protein ABEI52_10460, partial [Halobacteriaceae archaeon]
GEGFGPAEPTATRFTQDVTRRPRLPDQEGEGDKGKRKDDGFFATELFENPVLEPGEIEAFEEELFND